MSFNIWRITDGKAGHDSQSLGLCNAIKSHIDCTVCDISASHCKNNFFNFLLKQFPAGDKFEEPRLIIGAGHKTHIPMLAAKRARGGKTIVVMKPSLPRFFFDYCIIPKHDCIRETTNTISSYGALNTVSANTNKNADQTLILIGGPSKHFYWNNEKIITQILKLIDHAADKQFIIIGSRRTPDDFFSSLKKVTNEKVHIYNEHQCDKEKLNGFIQSAKQIWVSEESVSMVYEALSSGAEVGLLEVAPKQKNKISTSMNILVEEGHLTPFYSWEKTKTLNSGKIFNEAKRCTGLLAEMGVFD